MNDAEAAVSSRLWIALLNIDLQLYKGSIYKQRWGTPGGNDQALLCYDEALRALHDTPWPDTLRSVAAALTESVERFEDTLRARDVTKASSEQTRMTKAFLELREAIRAWPQAPTAVPASENGHARRPMDEVLPSM